MISSRWRPLSIILSLACLAGAGFFTLHLLNQSKSTPTSPPEIPSGVVDVEVREALAKARQRVIDDPHSDEAWGDLGLFFRAHRIHPESLACFSEAARLDPTSPRWPYLMGTVHLLDT